MREILFDLIFEAYSWRERGKKSKKIDMFIYRNNHGNGWSGLTRRQLTFIRDRISAYLEDTAEDNNWVYMMQCGHELDSPYRLSRNSRGHCSQHGFQSLVDGGLMSDDFLDEYRERKSGGRAGVASH